MLVAASLLLLVMLSGIAILLYSAGPPEQAVAPAPPETTAEEVARDEKTGEEKTSKIRAEPVRATYYGEEFDGAPTALGEPYDPDGFTAAHPHLPLGTRLLVSLGGRSVTVTVNDRMSSGSGHDLDLSLAAAQEIGLADVGTGVVDAEVLED